MGINKDTTVRAQLRPRGSHHPQLSGDLGPRAVSTSTLPPPIRNHFFLVCVYIYKIKPCTAVLRSQGGVFAASDAPRLHIAVSPWRKNLACPIPPHLVTLTPNGLLMASIALFCFKVRLITIGMLCFWNPGVLGVPHR